MPTNIYCYKELSDPISMVEYQRPTGLMGSRPREWIDDTLPACPMCHTGIPKWHMKMQFEGWKDYTRYFFRCSNCHGELSIPVETVSPSGSWNGSRPPSKDLRLESKGLAEHEFSVGCEYRPEELRAHIRPEEARIFAHAEIAMHDEMDRPPPEVSRRLERKNNMGWALAAGATVFVLLFFLILWPTIFG